MICSVSFVHGTYENTDFTIIDYDRYSTIHHVGVHFSVGPTSIQNLEIKDCKYVVRQGFLKMQCLIGKQWFYKCPFSEEYYKVKSMKCNSK